MPVPYTFANKGGDTVPAAELDTNFDYVLQAAGLGFKGEWNEGFPYTAGMSVSYGGSVFYANDDVTGTPPGDPLSPYYPWVLYLQRGATGASGGTFNPLGDYDAGTEYGANAYVTGPDTLAYYIPANYTGPNIVGVAPPTSPWVADPAAAAAAQALTYRDQAEAALATFYGIEKIGKADTPVDGTNVSLGTGVWAIPVKFTGRVRSIDYFGKLGGTVRYWRFTWDGIPGSNATPIAGTIQQFTALVGLNRATVDMAVNEGEYIGYHCVLGAISTVTSGGTYSGGIFFSTDDMVAFEVGQPVVTTTPQICFNNEYEIIDSGSYPVLSYDSSRALTLSSTLALPQYIGREAVPATGTALSTSTFLWFTVARAGIIRQFWAWGMSGGMAKVQRFLSTDTVDGLTHTRLTGEHVVAVPRADLVVDDSLDMAVDAGDRIGVWVTTNAVAYIITTGDSGGYYTTTSYIPEGGFFIDDAVTASTQLQMGVVIEYSPMDATVYETTVAAAATSAIVTDKLVNAGFVGRSSTPTNGSNGSVGAYAFHDLFLYDVAVTGGWYRAGSVGGQLHFRGYRVNDAGTGLTQLTDIAVIDGVSVDEIIVDIAPNQNGTFTLPNVLFAKGQGIGYFAEAGCIDFTSGQAADSGGWYRSATDSTEIPFDSLTKGSRLEIGFFINEINVPIGIEQQYTAIQYGDCALPIEAIPDGNSLTAGFQGSGQALSPWSNWVAAQWGVPVYNFGVSGQTIDQMISDAATQIDPLYDATKTQIVSAQEFYNQAVQNNMTATQLVDLMGTYCSGRRTVGFVVAVFNVPSMKPQGFFTELLRTQINAELTARYTEFADVLVDVAARPELQDCTNLTYYLSDQIHPNVAGQHIMSIVYREDVRTWQLSYDGRYRNEL